MDMFSKLPDEILESILCLLSIEEGGRSRVVCRRWEKLWMNTIRFTPRLDLDFGSSYGRKSISTIVNLVNRVMRLHEGQTLEDLTIKAYNLNEDHSDNINAWIEFAAQKRVKKLCLDFNTPIHSLHVGQPYSFPSNFPTMYWLRDLHTRRIQVSKLVIDRLFSNSSPFLERFSLIESTCIDEVLEVSSPNLKYLIIKSCKNLRHLRISTPILNSMEIEHLPRLRHVLVSAPNLSDATLPLRTGSTLIGDYLHLLCQFKTLKLVLTCMVSEHIWLQIPKMTQLEHLELNLIMVPPSCCSAILMAAPFLHTFKLDHQSCYDFDLNINLKRMEKHISKKMKENVTQSHQHLKVVELVNFNDSVVEFLLHLLKIAVSLEKLIIKLCLGIRRIRKRKNYRGDKYSLSYEENLYRVEKCAQLLKIMNPNIDVVLN